MPTVLRIRGYRFFFFSNEGFEPLHIHVESAENYAKFWLEPVTLVKSVGYSAKEQRQLREIIEGNKELLQEKWNEYFNQ